MSSPREAIKHYEAAFRYFLSLWTARFGLATLIAAALLGELLMRAPWEQDLLQKLSLTLNVVMALVGMAAVFTAYEFTVRRMTGR